MGIARTGRSRSLTPLSLSLRPGPNGKMEVSMTKLARLTSIVAARRAAVSPRLLVVPSNQSQPAARSRLVCRWVADPGTGRLSCVWTADDADDGVGWRCAA